MSQRSIIIICSARSYIGEAARVVHLAEAMRQGGHTVTLVGRRGHSVITEAQKRDLPHLALNLNSAFRLRSDYADVRTLRRLISKQHAEIVHAHRGKDHWVATAALRTHPHVSLIRTRHVVTPARNHLANHALYRRWTDGIICVSQAVADTFHASLPDLSTPIRIIPGGAAQGYATSSIDTRDTDSLRHELAIPDHSTIITTLARPDVVKGHIHIINAIPKILAQYPQAFFIFAYPRDNTYRETLTAAIAAHNVTDRVRWLGAQTSTLPLLALTDIGLIASVGSEGWSRVAVEFLSSGIPTVTTTVGSLPEIITHGKSGLHVPPANPEAIANALQQLLADASLRETLGRNAKRAAAPFTVQRMTANVLDFYDTIIAGKQT